MVIRTWVVYLSNHAGYYYVNQPLLKMEINPSYGIEIIFIGLELRVTFEQIFHTWTKPNGSRLVALNCKKLKSSTYECYRNFRDATCPV